MGEKLDVLHDHYKDTFSLIREWEKVRDLLFMAIIGVLAVLFLEIQFPKGLLDAVEPLTGPKLSALPWSVVVSATWAVLAAIAMRYCQAAIHVERQYEYLHVVEDRLSAAFGDAAVFCREGRHYLTAYPPFSRWAYVFYAWAFPIAVMAVCAVLLRIEGHEGSLAPGHLWFDRAAAAATALSLGLYRFAPPVLRYLGWGGRGEAAETEGQP